MNSKLHKNKPQSKRNETESRNNHRLSFAVLDGLSEEETEGNHCEEENEPDRISRLPDDVLFQILSKIPFDSALQTAALSTQWNGLWNRPVVLHETKEDIDFAVGDLILNFDKNHPLKKPRCLELHCGQGHVMMATIGLRGKVRLDFSKGKQVFPREFGWLLVMNSLDPTHEPPPYTFLIKRLDLTSVDYLTVERISNLISNFPELRRLTISKCRGLRSLRVDVVKHLRHLTVLDCPNLKSLFLEAYDLKSFRFRGKLCWFSFEGLLDLKDVMLDCREGAATNSTRNIAHKFFSWDMLNVRVLTVCGWMIQEIVSQLLSSGDAQHRIFSKIEELQWIDTSIEKHKIEVLVSFLKLCPSLERLFLSIDPTGYVTEMTEPSILGRRRSKLSNLKLVQLEGTSDNEQIIFLKKHLLSQFNVEPKTVVVEPGGRSWCLIRMPSPKKQGKGRFLYKFVEEVEEISGIPSQHAHTGL